ncbi:hypothetical protein C4K05_6124 [Pseudomonas chlororaphis subsp. aureofaciens]|uniref:Uncharacterized protein n=1 Tax=Pseudomonas chlororaphis subsp. aureofaciens TaxID=587851 RepID=A0AAD0ZTH6_9PSED|nr:hypothetical protein [Pseudomonas chlororaphis]AZE26535.1 hypothetical protein C4K08_6153 [Pseudomonas chlororaphis subsp. aureofaciens]AZE32776.1 hypothetical protein C4K07_6036 [Pseudomonas chlororaphis subsp. aureofaciens]AZE39058.1 hypothetical protein C4K06_6070 [Pseudomonas chlororaphis subsp. aureofaciens]AZE45419.1 hypothetical protein C4K05_6124 [Pseudomonas chlororaphis subsp. aureofaciens]QHC92522.1 hypothetical protein PchlR47_30855 [Pseudomonas chlororaphis]
MLALIFGAMIYATLLNLVLLSFIGLPLLLIAWLIPAFRHRMRRQPLHFGALAGVCAIIVVCTLWKIYSDDQLRKALHPQLEQDVQLDGLPLPAGAQLNLETLEPLDSQGQPQPYGLRSLYYAKFAAPHTINGVEVTELQMYGSGPFSKMLLSRDQIVAGWPCAGGTWVTLDIADADRLQPSRWSFSECTLVTGADVAGVKWPSSSEVRQYDGRFSIDTIGLASPAVVIQGIALSSLSLDLDKQRQPGRWSGQLAQDLTLGDWHYPRRMRVRQDTPGTLMFSPSKSDSAQNLRTGETLDAGRSIQQRRENGAVLWIKPNTGLGVLDW